MIVGFATIGESPRDDVVPYVVERLPAGVRVLEGGILDGLDETAIRALDGDGTRMITKTRDGRSYHLAYEKALPRMQEIVARLEQQGADLIVILCGADWTPIRAGVPVINLGRLFPNVVQALAGGQKLGVIKPDAGQVPRTIEQFTKLGLEVEVTSASPYGSDHIDQAERAAAELRERGVHLVWMSCIGMGEDMRDAVARSTGTPVILARSILARTIGELLHQPESTVAHSVPQAT